MKNKLIIALVLLGLVGIGLVYTQRKSAVSHEIKIGVSIPLSGPAATIGEQSKNVIRMAEEDLKVKYPNVAIKVVIEDNGSIAKTATGAAKKLTDIDNVDAIYTVITGPVLATLPIAKEKGIIFAYSAFTDVPRAEYDKSLKTFIDYTELCRSQGVEFTKLGYTKVVTVSEANGLAESCRDALATSFKGEVKVLNITSTTDVKVEILKLKKEGYQAITSTAFEGSMIKVVKATNESAYDISVLCNAAVCGTTNFKKTFTTEELKNVTIFTTSVVKAFEERYIAKYGNIPSAGLTSAVFDYEMIMDLGKGYAECQNRDAVCVLAKTQSSASNGALSNYSWKDRSVIPEIEYYSIVDGQLVRK